MDVQKVPIQVKDMSEHFESVLECGVVLPFSSCVNPHKPFSSLCWYLHLSGIWFTPPLVEEGDEITAQTRTPSAATMWAASCCSSRQHPSWDECVKDRMRPWSFTAPVPRAVGLCHVHELSEFHRNVLTEILRAPFISCRLRAEKWFAERQPEYQLQVRERVLGTRQPLCSAILLRSVLTGAWQIHSFCLFHQGKNGSPGSPGDPGPPGNPVSTLPPPHGGIGAGFGRGIRLTPVTWSHPWKNQ